MTQVTCNTENCGCEAPAEKVTNRETYSPRFDVWESDNELVLFGDLPGVAPENLDIRYEGREPTIVGKVSPRNAGKKSIHSEYGMGDFCRTFKIGDSIDSHKMSAELNHGVLKLHLPKAEATKPRAIPIRTN